MKEGNDLMGDQNEPHLSRSHEERVVRALRSRNLVNGNTFPGSVAAVIFLGLLGASYWAGTFNNKSRPAEQLAMSEAKYILLLYRKPGKDQGSANRAIEYANWMKGLSGSGIPATGEELGDETELLGTGGELPSTLVGYFIVGAVSSDQALEIAQSCPHLKYGGSIEVRPIK